MLWCLKWGETPCVKHQTCDTVTGITCEALRPYMAFSISVWVQIRHAVYFSVQREGFHTHTLIQIHVSSIFSLIFHHRPNPLIVSSLPFIFIHLHYPWSFTGFLYSRRLVTIFPSSNLWLLMSAGLCDRSMCSLLPEEVLLPVTELMSPQVWELCACALAGVIEQRIFVLSVHEKSVKSCLC